MDLCQKRGELKNKRIKRQHCMQKDEDHEHVHHHCSSMGGTPKNTNCNNQSFDVVFKGPHYIDVQSSIKRIDCILIEINDRIERVQKL